jgi:hypothetical protein
MTTDTDTQASIIPLEERLRYLERLIVEDSAALPTEQEALVFRVANVQMELTNIIYERKALHEFLDKYEKHEHYLSPSLSPLALERQILTVEAKSEIILASEQDLTRFADETTHIKSLEHVVGGVDLKSLEAALPQLYPLEQTHHDQVALTDHLSRRVSELTNAYNALINTLSEIFIAWDHILSSAETQVAATERERAME